MTQNKLDEIGSRGKFTQHSLKFDKTLPPGSSSLTSTLNSMSPKSPWATFWIDKISWTYVYHDIGHAKAKVIRPLDPVKITIRQSVLAVNNSYYGANLGPLIFSGAHSSQYAPAQHDFLIEAMDYEITNPNVSNYHQLKVVLTLDGTLVIPGSTLSILEQLEYLEGKIWSPKTSLRACQCDLRTIVAAGCQCGGS